LLPVLVLSRFGHCWARGVTRRRVMRAPLGAANAIGTGEKMMDAVFDWCVRLLVFLAAQLGMTYKEINVWIFVIVWPAITLALIGLVTWQRIRIRRLLKEAIANQAQ